MMLFFWLAFLAALSVVESHSKLAFSAGFSDNAVLQRSVDEGAKVYGFVDTEGDVTVTVKEVVKGSYTVKAEVHPFTGGGDIHPNTNPPPPHGNFVWVAVLHPSNASGGSYSITAQNDAGANATISSVTFGDVFFCSGQSNVRQRDRTC